MAMTAGALNGVKPAAGEFITPEELCRRFTPDVARFAAVLTSSPSEAEDVAQEALLKAVRALASYKPERGPVEAWLWRIVANAARDWRRSNLRRVRLLLRLASAAEAPNADAESIAIGQSGTQQLRTALARLSRRDRILIAMRFGADLEIDEIAVAVSSSPSATRKALERALHRLRSHLEDPRNA